MTDKVIRQREHEGWQQLPELWPDCLRKILAARGIEAEDDLVFSLDELPKPQQLLGMDRACELLLNAFQAQWHIVIVADFDSDGATSCAVAVRGLIAMGAKNVSYIVPNRFKHGYGLTAELVDEINQTRHADLLITVDNGIASIQGVKAAHDRGIKVLVTDHHLQGDELPNADAIINPNQNGDKFPSKHLAGVGVCFYLLLGLRQKLREDSWFLQQNIAEPNLMYLLDLVALGTVADVVKLDRLNRTFVSLGLSRIRAGQACPGILALIHVAGKDKQSLSTIDIGFTVAPRLNAAGRLQDMTIGIEALLSDDFNTALSQARQLDQINIERRKIEGDMQDQALTMLEGMSFDKAQKPLAYCLYDERWHQGVIGLLASRIKERQHRPVIAFAPSDDETLKGSARSIVGIHIRDVLAWVANKYPDLLSQFGGHAMAAGLTIKKANLADFEMAFRLALEQLIDHSMLTQDLLSDGELESDDLTVDFASKLPSFAPWGQGFPEPRFHGEFLVITYRMVGQQQNHLRLVLLLEDGREVTAMAFGHDKPDWLTADCRVLLHYRLATNEYREQIDMQLLVDNLFQGTLKNV